MAAEQAERSAAEQAESLQHGTAAEDIRVRGSGGGGSGVPAAADKAIALEVSTGLLAYAVSSALVHR